MPLELPPDYAKEEVVPPAEAVHVGMRMVRYTKVEDFMIDCELMETGKPARPTVMRVRLMTMRDLEGKVIDRQHLVYLTFPVHTPQGIVNESTFYPLPGNSLAEAVAAIPACSEKAYNELLAEIQAENEQRRKEAMKPNIYVPTAQETAVVNDALKQPVPDQPRRGHLQL